MCDRRQLFDQNTRIGVRDLTFLFNRAAVVDCCKTTKLKQRETSEELDEDNVADPSPTVLYVLGAKSLLGFNPPVVSTSLCRRVGEQLGPS